MNPEQWSVDDVGIYLEEHNFKQYKTKFCEENRIDGRALLSLTENDLRQPPLNIVPLGDVKNLCFLIDNLKDERILRIQHKGDLSERQTYATYTYFKFDQQLSSGQSSRSCSVSLLDSDDETVSVKNLKLDLKKFALSVLYIFIAHFTSGFAVAYAQEHMPDKTKYPPLPDIFLDILPYVPWAFQVTEGVIIVLSICGLTMLFFHKYRLLVIQRLMIITATIYLLRCLCVVSTAIPMPQRDYDCQRLEFKDQWERVSRVVKFYAAVGLKSSGIKTCGDYVFSGHTVIITLLILGINEYTPSSMTCLHTFNWVIGIFGTFFILLGHGHYTLDILLAFAISAKLFSMHHSMANNISQMTRDQHRIKKWFPIFYFFERDTDGPIPNEYEWPLPRFNKIESMFQDIILSLGNWGMVKTRINK